MPADAGRIDRVTGPGSPGATGRGGPAPQPSSRPAPGPSSSAAPAGHRPGAARRRAAPTATRTSVAWPATRA
ncbi:MAG: hypothetical protein EHM88_23395 [Candidatus Rokuibacteriota bacterium]|nr:MAG: hypothetical protein EHM88_23395 [Candidatus Rokubacteria bacterium]